MYSIFSFTHFSSLYTNLCDHWNGKRNGLGKISYFIMMEMSTRIKNEKKLTQQLYKPVQGFKINRKAHFVVKGINVKLIIDMNVYFRLRIFLKVFGYELIISSMHDLSFSG